MAHLEATSEDHERRLGDGERTVEGVRRAIGDMRVTIARIAVGAGAFVVLSNMFTALVVYELTRRG